MPDVTKLSIDGVQYDLKDTASGFITASSLPTKVSQLENDAGYLTQHQDISGVVRADVAQSLTDEQKQQARENIGAGTGSGGASVIETTFAALADATNGGVSTQGLDIDPIPGATAKSVALLSIFKGLQSLGITAGSTVVVSTSNSAYTLTGYTFNETKKVATSFTVYKRLYLNIISVTKSSDVTFISATASCDDEKLGGGFYYLSTGKIGKDYTTVDVRIQALTAEAETGGGGASVIETTFKALGATATATGSPLGTVSVDDLFQNLYTLGATAGAVVRISAKPDFQFCSISGTDYSAIAASQISSILTATVTVDDLQVTNGVAWGTLLVTTANMVNLGSGVFYVTAPPRKLNSSSPTRGLIKSLTAGPAAYVTSSGKSSSGGLQGEDSGFTWYRVWSDGVLEQGGCFSYNAEVVMTTGETTFPKAFKKGSIPSVLVTGGAADETPLIVAMGADAVSATSFVYVYSELTGENIGDFHVSWYAVGKA